MICRIVVGSLIALWVAALALFVVGINGWFGAEPTPFAPVFLLLLGLPWTMALAGLPEGMQTAAMVVFPLITIGILAALCRLLRRAWR